MPISTGSYTENTTTEEQRNMAAYRDLQSRYATGDDDYDQMQINNEGIIASTVASGGRGIQEGANNILNLPTDLAGFNRWADIDLIKPREGFWNESVTAVSQFITGLPVGGPAAKGAVKIVQGLRKGEKALGKGSVARKTKLEDIKDYAKRGLVVGAGADFVAFSGNESLMFHLLNAHPELQNAYSEITKKDGWQNMTAAELQQATMGLGSFSAERMARNWGGRGLNVAEGAFLGALVNVFWRSAKLKFNNDSMTKDAWEGNDSAIQQGVANTEKRHGKVLNDELSDKEKQELAAFKHGPMVKEGAVTPEQKTRVLKEEAELAEAQAELAEAADNLKTKQSYADIDETDALAPSTLDEVAERNAAKIGIDDVIDEKAYEKGTIGHDTGYRPITHYVDDLPEGQPIFTDVQAKNRAFINVNRDALNKVWETKGNKVKLAYDSRTYAKDAFDNYETFEAFTIARERARVKFRKLTNESIAGYRTRLDQAAANELKRKGLGNFWKYEFDAIKGMEQFKVDDESLRQLIFKDAEAAKKLTKDIISAKGGAGVDLNASFMKALDLINIDSTMTDAGQKYMTSRVMKYFMDTMRHGFTATAKDPVGDQLAKAIGWHGDANRMTAKDWLRDDLLNQMDDIATSTGLTPQGVAERMRKGYGDFKHLFKETSVDDSLKEDVAVMKELYIRTWAYRLDQAVTMKQLEAAAAKIANFDGTPNTKMLAEFATVIERVESKLAAFRNLRKAQGRSLAANKKFQFASGKGLGGTDNDQILEEIINRAGGKQGMASLASKIDALINGNKGNPKGGAAAAQGLLAKTITGIDVHNEYWLNSLLSGARTQVVNAIGTTLHMVYKPLEGIIGSIGGDAAARTFFRKQMVYSAHIMTETIKVLGALGLNKASRIMGRQTDEAYMANRAALFEEGGQGAGALAGAKKAFRTGKGTLESRSELFDVQPSAAITGDLLGDSASQWAKDAIDVIGNMIRLPSRFMITTDELFKQLQFRASSMAKLFNEAVEALPRNAQTEDNIKHYMTERFQGLIRSNGSRFTPDVIRDEAYRNYTAAVTKAESEGTALPEEFQNKEQYILDYVDKNYVQNKDKSMLSEFAMDWAEDATFTRGLDVDLKRLQEQGHLTDASSFSKGVQDFATKHSWLRVVMPFIRTPVNLLKFPLQRLPLLQDKALNKKSGFLKKLHMRYQADILSDDPIKVAEAKGRMRTGALMYGSIAMFAGSGQVTGKGPTNANERRSLMATGWRPYSIRVGDRYISYARLDPFSTVLGLAADSVEFVREAGRNGDLDENWVQTMATAGVYSLSNNIANKSYLAGLSNILSSLTDPVGNGSFEKLMEKQLTSYIPKAVSQFTVVTDDNYIRKSYGLLEAMQNQIPFLAGGIEPTRNILGDPMEYVDSSVSSRASSIFNPFLSTKYKKDEVLDSIAALHYGFGAPEPKIRGKSFLDMRKYEDENGRSAFDYYQERIGTIKLGGKTLRERLQDYFKSSTYRKQTEFSTEVGFDEMEADPRIKEVKSIIARYRTKAKKETLREYPDLTAAIKAYEQNYSELMQSFM